MERIHCEIHSLDIVVYEKNEEHLFVDDNREEIAIFYDDNDKRYLKRYVSGQCDEFCETIKYLIKQSV